MGKKNKVKSAYREQWRKNDEYDRRHRESKTEYKETVDADVDVLNDELVETIESKPYIRKVPTNDEYNQIMNLNNVTDKVKEDLKLLHMLDEGLKETVIIGLSGLSSSLYSKIERIDIVTSNDMGKMFKDMVDFGMLKKDSVTITGNECGIMIYYTSDSFKCVYANVDFGDGSEPKDYWQNLAKLNLMDLLNLS